MNDEQNTVEQPAGGDMSRQQVAAKRGWQTVAQGLAIDVAVAVAIVILAGIDSITTTAGVAALGVAVGKSVLTAVAAYVVRRYRDRSGFTEQG